jgi:putative transposase
VWVVRVAPLPADLHRWRGLRLAAPQQCIGDDSPFRIGPLRTVSEVEEATSAWVHWYNTARLMRRLGRIPPTEYEAKYYAAHRADQPVAHK